MWKPDIGLPLFTNNTEKSDEGSSRCLFGGHNEQTYNPETHVKVRVLSSQHLPVDLQTGLRYQDEIQRLQSVDLSNPQNQYSAAGFLSSLLCCYTGNTARPRISTIPPQQPIKDLDTIIIHIHGGGWVSMSSGSH